MAHIWLQNEAREWTAHPLTADDSPPASKCTPSGIHFLNTTTDNQENWVVVAGHGSGITINGVPLLIGIHVLRNRDEIRWSREGFGFFSSEELASVVDMPAGDRTMVCPRCKQEILPGTPALRCPRCGIWHHQSEQLPCYTYAENCATCTRKTSLDGGYDWIPEEM